MRCDLDLLAADPVDAGFDPIRLNRVVEILQEGVEDKLYPGGSLCVYRNDRPALFANAGYTDFSCRYGVKGDTLFDLASLTKPIAAASSILILLQEGRLHLGQSVAEFFPGRSLPHLKNVLLYHLLTHTSGLPPWKDLYSKGQTREQAIDELFEIPLNYEPGTHYAYSCMGYIMLSLVIEVVAGENIAEFSRKRIFEPVGMYDTMFNPYKLNPGRIAATDNCHYRKRLLVGEVHDGNAFAMNGISGNAGLFSTAYDLARFCHMVTDDKDTCALRLFNAPVLKRMFTNALPESIGGQTIGWFIFPNDMLPGGDLVSKNAIGHSGFTGTAIIIDPDNNLCITLLTNRVCSNDDGTSFRHLRRRMFNAVIGSIVC